MYQQFERMFAGGLFKKKKVFSLVSKDIYVLLSEEYIKALNSNKCMG